MKLSPNEIELFYKLYHSLLIYVNKKFKILDGLNSREDVMKFEIDKINTIRDKLYKHPELIDSFVSDNPFHFSSKELKIIHSWKNFVKGKFLIFRYLKDYTVFLKIDEETPKAYGVVGLVSSFEEMVGPRLPVMVQCVLLPFNNKIIYDSIFYHYSIFFGGGIRRSYNDSYQQAKSQFGIITSLPFTAKKREQSDSDKLKFYLKSERNREQYIKEILELIEKDKELLVLYYQEMGKIHSRAYRKRLHNIGLTDGWFAIFDDTLITSGVTRDDVERTLQKILPPARRKLVYIFQLKGK